MGSHATWAADGVCLALVPTDDDTATFTIGDEPYVYAVRTDVDVSDLTADALRAGFDAENNPVRAIDRGLALIEARLSVDDWLSFVTRWTGPTESPITIGAVAGITGWLCTVASTVEEV